MSPLGQRGNVTEYVLIAILVAIVSIFAIQRYGATLRGKTAEIGDTVADLGGSRGDGGAADVIESEFDGYDEGAATGSRGGIGAARGDAGTTTRSGPGVSGGSSTGSSAGLSSGAPSAGDAGSPGGEGDTATAFDANMEEVGSLPSSEDEESAVDVLGFRITWGTATWLALLVVAAGFAWIRHQTEQQKKNAKAMKAARAKRGTPA